MGKLVMIILTKSSKFSAKCVAGINVENGEWVRLVSDDVEKHGAIPDYPVCRKTPCFSYGDIRYFHRIYASN